MVTLAGVIGYPIGHSKSPMIHGYWLHKYGISGHYVPLNVRPTDFRTVIRTLGLMGFRGVNITVPHKEAAIQYSDKISDNAAMIRAANTLAFRPDGLIHADNSDGYGFCQNILETVPDWRAGDGPALVIGAGGAARAVIHSLLSEGVPEIYLVNRTIERAGLLRRDFGNRVKIFQMSRTGDLAGHVNTVVNASSLGMVGMPTLKFPPRKLRKGTVVCDIVYAPRETEFLKMAEQEGCRIVGGLGMLLHQAAYSFNFWFGILPEITPRLRAMVEDG